jgi:Domain of unknown function (DUF6460)
MDRTTFFGGSPLGVILRLVLISVAVGVVMKALDITPYNLLQRLDALLKRIYDFGLQWALEPLLLGAAVVVPIWLIVRLFAVSRKGSE